MDQYRHEWKHEISLCDCVVLRRRLRAVAEVDAHARDGRYQIRSLYFDDLRDKALREKLDGVDRREKFRLRYYDGDPSRIRLEKKSRRNGLGSKSWAPLTAREAQAVVDGAWDWMPASGRDLVVELYSKMRGQGLRPKTIVDYTREPFVYGPGNVRVTLDYGLRTGLRCTDFLDPSCVTVPVRGPAAILEVKWDAYLPAIIQDAVQLPGRRAGAFSKYAACRIYG